ncbi:hypothetical protein D3C75_1302820 [compost metagenome]
MLTGFASQQLAPDVQLSAADIGWGAAVAIPGIRDGDDLHQIHPAAALPHVVALDGVAG